MTKAGTNMKWAVVVAAVLSVIWPLAPIGVRSWAPPSLDEILDWYLSGGFYSHATLLLSIAHAVLIVRRGGRHLREPQAVGPFLVLPALTAFAGLLAAYAGALDADAAMSGTPPSTRLQLWEGMLSLVDTPRVHGLLAAASGSWAAVVVMVLGQPRLRPARWSRVLVAAAVAIVTVGGLSVGVGPELWDSGAALVWAGLAVVAVGVCAGVLGAPDDGADPATRAQHLRAVLACASGSLVGIAAPLVGLAISARAQAFGTLATAPRHLPGLLLDNVAVAATRYEVCIALAAAFTLAAAWVWAVVVARTVAAQCPPATQALARIAGAGLLAAAGYWGLSRYTDDIVVERTRGWLAAEKGGIDLELAVASSGKPVSTERQPLRLTAAGAFLGERSVGLPQAGGAVDLTAAFGGIIHTAEDEVPAYRRDQPHDALGDRLCPRRRWGALGIAADKNLSGAHVVRALQRLQAGGVCRVDLIVRAPASSSGAPTARLPRGMEAVERLLEHTLTPERAIDAYLGDATVMARVDASVRVSERSVELRGAEFGGAAAQGASTFPLDPRAAERIVEAVRKLEVPERPLIGVELSGASYQDLIAVMDWLRAADEGAHLVVGLRE